VQVQTGLALLQEQQVEAAQRGGSSVGSCGCRHTGCRSPSPLKCGGAQQYCSWTDPPSASGGGVSSSDYLHNTAASWCISHPTALLAGQAGQQQRQHPTDLHWDGGGGVLSSDVSGTKQALLSNMAYVQLLLGHPDQALSAAQALLACSSVHPEQHYLASCYAAEALCLLGRVEEAVEQLQSHQALFMDCGRAAGSSVDGGASSSGPAAAAAAHDGSGRDGPR